MRYALIAVLGVACNSAAKDREIAQLKAKVAELSKHQSGGLPDDSGQSTTGGTPAAPADPLQGLPATMPEVVAALRDKMTDSVNDMSPGAALLAIWGAAHMKWDDVAVSKNETSFARVRKDSEEARGKRICASGGIIEIAVERVPTGKVADGLLMTYSGDLIRFAAVGGSGDLVGQSNARICGVVVGRYEYSNSAGGTGHAVQVVGMFDLPENHPNQKRAAGVDSCPRGSACWCLHHDGPECE